MTETTTEPRVQRVIVTDFDMPFVSILSFLVKASLAAIPAAIILAFVFAVLFGALSAIPLRP